MNKAARAFFVAALAASVASGGKVPGLPDRFTFSGQPFRSGSAWFIPASESRLYRDEHGKPMCEYLGDLRFPAHYESRMDAYYCPPVTVRHIREVNIVRSEGKCRGYRCMYDVTGQGGAQLTTDLVDYCPDIIVTVAKGGQVSVVAAKSFRKGENSSRYFRNGKHISQTFDTDDILVEKCGNQHYRDQLAFWLGSLGFRNAYVVDRYVDDPAWDGF